MRRNRTKREVKADTLEKIEALVEAGFSYEEAVKILKILEQADWDKMRGEDWVNSPY